MREEGRRQTAKPKTPEWNQDQESGNIRKDRKEKRLMVDHDFPQVAPLSSKQNRILYEHIL